MRVAFGQRMVQSGSRITGELQNSTVIMQSLSSAWITSSKQGLIMENMQVNTLTRNGSTNR